MSNINDYLDYISTANYGSDVREAIVSSIRECYKDATGHPDSVAALVQEYIDREEKIDGAVTALTGLYNSLGDIVYSYDYNNGVSGIHIAENEFGCVDQITLGPGKWIIKIVSFFSRIINASPNVGTIYLSFSNTLDSDGFPIPLNDTYNYKDDLYYGTILKSVGSHTHFIKMIELTEERTIYMWIQHDGALSDDIVVSPHMTAMKIGESTPSDGTSLADQVVENTEDIAVLEGKVATNISDISTLDSDVDALEEDVSDIKADLDESVDDLKSAITLNTEYMETGEHVITESELEQGTTSQGVPSSSTTRIRTAKLYSVKSGDKLSFVSGTTVKNIAVQKYNTSRVWQSEWKQWTSSGKWDINFDGFIRLIYRKDSSNGDVTPSDYDATTAVINSSIKNSIDGVANDVDTLKDNIDNVNEQLFSRYGDRPSVPSGNMAENWKLDGTGKSVSDNNYTLLKSEVTAGDVIWVRCDSVFQFQSAKRVPSALPNTALIGEPITTATDGLVVVPTGATWVIVSTTNTNRPSRGVYNYWDNIVGGKFISVKNIIGSDGNVLYPVYIPSGTTITISTADGEALGQRNLNFITYDANKLEAEYWNFTSSNAKRTFTTSQNAYYVGWSKQPVKTVFAEAGNNAPTYTPYAVDIKNDIVAKKILLGNEAIETSNFITKCTQFSALLLGDTVNNVIAPSDFETFLFFTDPHLVESSDWQNRFYEMMPEIKKYYDSTPTTFCISGGDWLGNSDLPSEACYKMGFIGKYMESHFDNCYMLVGNHDTNYQGKKDSESAAYTTRLSNQSIIDLWYRKGKKAYYKFDGANTRFYAFDTGTEGQQLTSYDNYGWEQAEWFAECLLSDNSTHIAITGHILYNDLPTNSNVCPIMQEILSIAEAYNNRTTISVNGTSYDYTNALGKIEFLVCGHSHGDYNGTLNGIPYFLTANVRNGTGLCSTFDLVMVDYDNSVINLVRIGNGSDRTISLS